MFPVEDTCVAHHGLASPSEVVQVENSRFLNLKGNTQGSPPAVHCDPDPVVGAGVVDGAGGGAVVDGAVEGVGVGVVVDAVVEGVGVGVVEDEPSDQSEEVGGEQVLMPDN